MNPVLVVHGLWDTPARIEPLVDGLRRRGIAHVAAMKLTPNDGSVALREMAKQVVRAINGLGMDAGSAAIDVVGFSMGALLTRAALVLEHEHIGPNVQKFISISGPHAGAWNAHALPSRRFPGIADMRPKSAFLLALESAPPVSETGTEVHCLYTPYDLMVMGRPEVRSSRRRALSGCSRFRCTASW